MKKLICVAVFLLLSGCASIQNLYEAYTMAKFDVNEYQYITRIRTHAQLGSPLCGSPDVKEHVKYIFVVAQEYKNYAELIPNNENSFKLATTLTQITDDFAKKYQNNETPSIVYCKAKFMAIERSSENIQKVIGAKPR
jgi:hypothetical protein